MSGITSADFEELYRAHAGEILGYLRRRTEAADAADLLAETFLCTWRRRDDLPAADQRRAWLFSTARRLLLAHYRHPAPRPVPVVEPRQPSPAIRDERSSDIVSAVLTELREPDRELLTLTVWERLPVVEAGRILGLSGGAARVRLHRIRQRLAADPRLAGLVDDSPGRAAGASPATSASDPAPSGGVAQPATC